MSSYYKVSFKELRQEGLKDVFASLEPALTKLGIDFYLIGALARDTWFAQRKIRALGTKDVDFAVLVTDENSYKQLKEYLIEKEGFLEVSSNEYCLIDKAGNEIDLLPFGAVEIEGKKVLDSEGLFNTGISGFKEVYEEAIEVNFEDRHQFKVSSLAGIAILKLIAYDDRPEIRNSDIKDIVAILNNYIELEPELVYEKNIDLFAEGEDNLLAVSARVLGRQMQSILNRNAVLKKRIESILEDSSQSLEKSPIGRLMISEKIESLEEAVVLIKQLLLGISERLPAQ